MFYVLVTRRFKDNQLVRDDPVRDLLVLRGVQLVRLAHLVHLHFAPRLLLRRFVEDGGDVDLLVAAGVLVVGAERAVERHLHLGLLLVHVTVAHLRNVVENVASVTLEHIEVGPDLPVDLTPGNPVSLSNKGYKFLKVPGSINDMLGPDLAVIINVALCLATVKHFALAHGEQLVTVSAFVQVITFFF